MDASTAAAYSSTWSRRDRRKRGDGALPRLVVGDDQSVAFFFDPINDSTKRHSTQFGFYILFCGSDIHFAGVLEMPKALNGGPRLPTKAARVLLVVPQCLIIAQRLGLRPLGASDQASLVDGALFWLTLQQQFEDPMSEAPGERVFPWRVLQTIDVPEFPSAGALREGARPPKVRGGAGARG